MILHLFKNGEGACGRTMEATSLANALGPGVEGFTFDPEKATCRECVDKKSNPLISSESNAESHPPDKNAPRRTK